MYNAQNLAGTRIHVKGEKKEMTLMGIVVGIAIILLLVITFVIAYVFTKD